MIDAEDNPVGSNPWRSRYASFLPQKKPYKNQYNVAKRNFSVAMGTAHSTREEAFYIEPKLAAADPYAPEEPPGPPGIGGRPGGARPGRKRVR